MISPNTPLIDTSELQDEQNKARLDALSEIDSLDIENISFDNIETPNLGSKTNIPKPYAQIMNSILNKRRPNLENTRNSSVSPGRSYKSRPVTRESERGAMRHWWDNEAFLDKAMNTKNSMRHPIELRSKRNLPRPQSKTSNENRKLTTLNYENSTKFNF